MATPFKKFTIARLIQPYAKQYVGLGDEENFNAFFNPVATTADLADITSDINTVDKYIGKPAYDSDTGEPVWASGADPADAWVGTGGGGGTPGAPTDSVQYNDSGVFTGSAGFTFLDNFLAPLLTLGVGGAVQSPNITLNGGTGGGAEINWEQNFTQRGKFQFIPSAAGFTNIIRLTSQAGPFEIASSATVNLRVQNGIGLEIFGGSGMGIRLQDNAAADFADVAGFGQFYISESDNFPYYRSAAGVEYNLTEGGLTSPVGAADGGTGITAYNTGAILRATGTTSFGTIERGTSPWGKLLQLVAGVPQWEWPLGVRLTEGSDHPQTPAATFGEIWLDDATNQTLMFTDDAGVDHGLNRRQLPYTSLPAVAVLTFTGIPDWATNIVVEVVGLSTNGTSIPMLQLGDSGGLENTNYDGSALSAGNTVSSSSHTNGFRMSAAWAASNVAHGSFRLSRADVTTNVWTCVGGVSLSNTNFNYLTRGSKALSAALDRVAFTTVGGANTFDAGSVSLNYW